MATLWDGKVLRVGLYKGHSGQVSELPASFPSAHEYAQGTFREGLDAMSFYSKARCSHSLISSEAGLLLTTGVPHAQLLSLHNGR